MIELLQYSAAIVIGFIVLVWGADRFVYGAAGTARNLGVPSLIIGLTIVGFGTSAPEILVSTSAAIQGNPGIAVGNAIGSNIANIGLVLGTTALLFPLLVESNTLKREFPIMLIMMGITLLLILDYELSRYDGVLLISGLVALTIWLIRISKTKKGYEPMVHEYDNEIPRIPTMHAVGWTVLGLTLLLISSQILIYGAVNIAKYYQVSDLVIGLTIIAIGTSLPELATSVMSALKKEPDIAIGNIIGSNMFNLLAVLGIPAVISPIPLEHHVITRDYAVMCGMSVLLLFFSYGFRGQARINRLEGGILLTCYIAYMVYLYFRAVQT